MNTKYWPSWCLLLLIFVLNNKKAYAADDDYNVLHRDGSFQFGYNTPDSYHYADGDRRNIVRGEFGGRNPATGAIDSTIYTAGPRGFRPRGKNVVRKYDLNQNGPRPIGSPDDPYYDPFEDPSYRFSFRTRTYQREENANSRGDVTGKFSYIDDVGERHNVDFIAGEKTGFHVRTPYPDSNPRAYGPLYFTGRGRPIPRGRTSIQRGLDGSYRFVSAGPDQRRTETSDSSGHVRGSYTYLDDKGVQHSVHYIAGPETGYRVLKNVKGPHLPTIFPFGRPDIIPPDFYDYVGKDNDLFDTAASGHIKPIDNNNIGGNKPSKDDSPTFDGGIDVDKDDFDKLSGDFGKPIKGPSSTRPTSRPSFGGNKPKPPYDEYDDSDFGADLFGTGGESGIKPSGGGGPSAGNNDDDGSYKPSGDDGSYKPAGSTTSRPNYQSDLGGNKKPQPSLVRPSGRPGGSRPSFFDYDDGGSNDDDFGLFGSETGTPSRPTSGKPSKRPTSSRPSSTTSRPMASGGNDVIHFGLNNDGDDECPKCKGTIVTNVGDRLFTVPPGVSVRAHVQSIDLIPADTNIPSPSEQFKSETKPNTEQLNASVNRIVNESTNSKSELDNIEESTSSTISTTPSSTTEIKPTTHHPSRIPTRTTPSSSPTTTTEDFII